MVRAPRSIPDYDEVMAPLRARRLKGSGQQPGDPAKAAAAILALVESPNPPAHLLLGSDALRLVEQKLASLRADIDAWRPVTLSTDFL